MYTQGLKQWARSFENSPGPSLPIRTVFGPGPGFGSGSGPGSGVRSRGFFLGRERSWLVGTALGGFLAACGGSSGGGGGDTSETMSMSMSMTMPDNSGMNPPASTPATPFSVETAPSSGTLQRTKVEDLDFSNVFSSTPTTYSATGLPEGLTLDTTTGRLTGATERTGPHVVTLTATASDGQKAITSFTLTLTDANSAPVLAMPLENFTLRQDQPVSVSLALDSFFTDTDVTDMLLFRASGSLPAGLEFEGPNATIEGELSSTPTSASADGPQANAVLEGSIDQAQEGSYTLTLTVNDGNSDGHLIEELVITVAPGNTAPILRPGLVLEHAFKRDEALSLTLAEFFTDPDYGSEAPTYAVLESELPAGLSLSDDGTITGMVSAEGVAGVVVVTVTVSDTEASPEFEFSLTLIEEGTNRPPRVKQALGDQILPENRSFTLDLEDVFEDQDSEDTLTYQVSAERAGVEGPIVGLPAGLVLSGNNQILSGAVTEEYALGAYTFTLRATDDSGDTGMDSASYVFELRVVNVNDAPAGAIPARTVALEAAIEIHLSPFISDAEGDALTYTVASSDVLPLTLGGLSESVLMGTAPATAGSFEVTVTAMDAHGAASEFVFMLEVVPADQLPANQAPLVVTGDNAPPSSLTAPESRAMTWNVSDWFTDPDPGDPLSYTAIVLQGAAGSQTEAALPRWLTLNGTTGALAIAAGATDAGEIGTYTLVITARDKANETAVHTATLEVRTANTAPVLTNEAPTTMTPLTVDEAAAETWTLADWFSDPDGDTLTYTAAMDGLPTWLELDTAMGELTIAAAATDDADVGEHSFTLTATDEVGESVVLVATLTVENVAEAPVVVTGAMGAPATVTGMEGGTAQAFTISGWFTDPDGDTLAFALGDDSPDWATFDSMTGVLSLAFNDTDDADVDSHALEVIATDSGGESTAHTLAITVSNVNDAPTAAAAAMVRLEAMEGLAASWDVSEWFSDEDTNLPSSPEVLTYAAMVLEGTGDSQTSMELPDWLALDSAVGVLTIAAGAADDAQIGPHTLAVTASDKAGAMVVHMTTLTITDTENEPTLSNLALTNPRFVPAIGESLVLDLTGAFTDDDEAGEDAADALTFEVSSSIDDTMTAENIITAMLAAETLMLTLTPGEGSGPSGGFGQQEQQETVTITAIDAEGGRDTATFIVTTRPNVLNTSELAPTHGFIIQGDAAGDQLGRSVSGAGDVNGDGLADLIVGAHFGDDGGIWAGEAYIVYGRAGDGTQFGMADSTTARRQVVDTTSFAPSDGFIIQGDVEQELLGMSVAGAGDINGDGVGDLIVGAHFGNDGGFLAGEAYIIYGKAGTDGMQFGMEVTTGTAIRQVLDTTNLAPADGFILQGDTEEGMPGSDLLGVSVAGVGDINGDGIGDLIVGANGGSDGGFSAGEAYIIYGKAGTTGTQFGMPVHVTAMGVTINDGMTTTVTETLDTATNMMVTVTLDVSVSDDVLAASSMRQVLDTTNLAPEDGFILQGDVPNDQLGGAVSGVGDINGDGYNDLIVGAQYGDDGGGGAGEAYIIYGKAGTTGTQFGMMVETMVGGNTIMRQVLDTSMLAPADGFILQGDAAGDALGNLVSGAGDINGDGIDDLIVGANWGDDGGDMAGEAYIIYGKAGTDGTQFGMEVTTGTAMRQVLDTTNLAPTDGFILQGDMGEDSLGNSVSGAGDINGDGIADLIVGARGGDDGGDMAGEAYIIYGKAGTDGMQFGTTVTDGGGTRQVLDTTGGLGPSDGFILQGDAGEDNLGWSVSGAGDVNGDGFDDLIVGATGGDDGGEGAGEAYVIYGGTHLGEVVTTAQTLTGMTTTAPAGADAAAVEAAARAAFLLGGAGNDRLEAHADTTVLYGGAGDDVLSLADGDFRRVDGGSGSDTLVLAASLTLDFTDAAVRGRVRGIEAVSLSDGAEVSLDLLSVYALVESRNNGGPHTDPGEAFLRLEGTGMVTLNGTWTPTVNAEGPDLYTQASAKLLIDDGLVAA